MSVFTKLGVGLWAWEPFKRLERGHEDIVGRCSKLFWIALYTAPEAKLVVPGMFLGSVTTMAESASIPVDDARTYLDRLRDEDLVDYDVKNRVLRLTELPDGFESPSNGNTIRGWWRKFKTVPTCAVRDAHVSVLRWIMEEWSRSSGKPISLDHTAAWSETFGRMSVPVRPRKRRHVQTSLFEASSKPLIDTVVGSKTNDRAISEAHTVDNSDSLHQMKENNNSETNAEPFAVGSGTNGIRIKDQDQDQDLRSEGGSGGGQQFVPFVPFTVINGTGFDVQDLVNALAEASSGKFPRALTPETWNALSRAIDAAAMLTRTPGALACLREFVARGMEGFPRQPLSLEEKTRPGGELAPDIVAAPGWLSRALEHALAWKQRTDDQVALAAAARKELGFE